MYESITVSNNYTIAQVLNDWWSDFMIAHAGNIRQTVKDNVAKVRHCGNNEYGFSTYTCSLCGDQKHVPHTCKSRFCNSCGKVKNDEWVERAQTMLFNVSHKHLVFTIPSELWPLFRSNRKHLSLLFKSASQAVTDWAATRNFKPGLVTVMHTFGSQLNFNCHIHVIYTLGGISLKTGKWTNVEFVAATSLKARFKTILLGHIRRLRDELIIMPEVKRLWLEKFQTADLYNVQSKLYAMEWYLYVGEKLDNADFATKYIGRYAKRPCLAETRIKYYSKNENIIKFEYKDKVTNKYEEIETDPLTFIGLLVVHIPEKHFQMIRYYSIYGGACRKKILKQIQRRLTEKYGFATLQFGPPRKTWRERQIESTGVDPLKCAKCDIVMSLTAITYQTRDGTMKTVNFF